VTQTDKLGSVYFAVPQFEVYWVVKPCSVAVG